MIVTCICVCVYVCIYIYAQNLSAAYYTATKFLYLIRINCLIKKKLFKLNLLHQLWETCME